MGLSTNGPITPYLNSWAYNTAADRDGHHHYEAFYNGKRVSVRAATLLDAHGQAEKHFKVTPKKAHMIATVLVAKFNEAPVQHSTASFG